MRFEDLFIHVYWRPEWFWGIAIALALIDVWATWGIGRAIRICGRPWLSARRRLWVNGAILASFVLLSVLRFYREDSLALGWFLGSQLTIGLVSIKPLLGRMVALRRSAGAVGGSSNRARVAVQSRLLLGGPLPR